jgi:hydroxymethylglutaryl-CoA lyase
MKTRIIEVGPRDGLQNEKGVIPTDRKVAFVDALSSTGVDEIEVTAFVSPKWVPQLADASEVFSRITRQPNVVYSALVPNEQGLDRALEVGASKIAVFAAASETFSHQNINATIAESMGRFVPVIRRARAAGLAIRGYISTAFWCPYEGRIAPEKVASVATVLDALGVEELSIGDTIGKAVADDVERLLEKLLPLIPAPRLAMHFHDTYGQALDNVACAWRHGIVAFDASVTGLGGCPYAPGAPGNVATEAVVARLRREGAEVNIDADALRRAGETLRASLSEFSGGASTAAASP